MNGWWRRAGPGRGSKGARDGSQGRTGRAAPCVPSSPAAAVAAAAASAALPHPSAAPRRRGRASTASRSVNPPAPPPTIFGGLKGGGEEAQELALVHDGHQQAAWRNAAGMLGEPSGSRARATHCGLLPRSRPGARRRPPPAACCHPQQSPPQSLALLSPTPTCLQGGGGGGGGCPVRQESRRVQLKLGALQRGGALLRARRGWAAQALRSRRPPPPPPAQPSRGLRRAAQAAPQVGRHLRPLPRVEEHGGLRRGVGSAGEVGQGRDGGLRRGAAGRPAAAAPLSWAGPPGLPAPAPALARLAPPLPSPASHPAQPLTPISPCMVNQTWVAGPRAAATASAMGPRITSS